MFVLVGNGISRAISSCTLIKPLTYQKDQTPILHTTSSTHVDIICIEGGGCFLNFPYKLSKRTDANAIPSEAELLAGKLAPTTLAIQDIKEKADAKFLHG